MKIYDSLDGGADIIVGAKVDRCNKSGIEIDIGAEFLSNDGKLVEL